MCGLPGHRLHLLHLPVLLPRPLWRRKHGRPRRRIEPEWAVSTLHYSLLVQQMAESSDGFCRCISFHCSCVSVPQ